MIFMHYNLQLFFLRYNLNLIRKNELYFKVSSKKIGILFLVSMNLMLWITYGLSFCSRTSKKKGWDMIV